MMSKNGDIRSFFSAIGQKGSSQPVAKSKKRPIVVSSDEEDTSKKIKHSATIDKITPSKQQKRIKKPKPSSSVSVLSLSGDEEDQVKFKTPVKKVRKQIVIVSDSEEEENTHIKPRNKLLKPVPKNVEWKQKNAADFFGKEKIKQTPIEKNTSQSSKQNDSKSSKSDDKFRATLKQLDGSLSKNDMKLENTLLDLDDEFEDNILDETINNAVAKEMNSKKSTPKTSKTPKSKTPNQRLNDSGMDPDQEKYERRRQSFAMYQKYLNRAGPVNQGNKELPEGKSDCLKNLCFLKTGVLDSMEREAFENLVKKHGGRTVSAISRKVNYLIVGVDAGPAKLSKADEYGIITLSEDELLDKILIQSGMKPKYVNLANENINTIVLNKSDDKLKSGSDSKKKEKRSDEKHGEELKNTSNRGKSDIDVSIEWEPKLKKPKHDDIPEFTKISPKKKVLKSVAKPVFNSSKPSTSTARHIIKTVPLPAISVESVVVDKANISLVDKHKPTSSLKIIGQRNKVELLSNWLKNWSKNHIGKDKPKLQKPSMFARDNDGAYFKCALLSGPPGVGKTTAANLVSKELGFDVVEYNASDTRSKKMLQQEIQKQLQSKSIASFAKDGEAPTAKHVLLMDEVDGMSGNEDRGGVQELILLIKKTNIPIICMCNDRNHQKMRSLLNHCFDLPFGKPTNQQIKAIVLSICFREGIKIDGEILEQMITTAGNDVRQVLNHLTMWTAMQKGSSAAEENTFIDIVENSNTEYKFNQKDVIFGPWQVIRKQLDWNEYKTLSLAERSRLFYHDYSIGPLFMQENYLHTTPHDDKKTFKSKRAHAKNYARRIAQAASAISMSDVIEKKIRSTNNWSLLDAQGLFATVIPSYHVHGTLKGVNFPAWLGKNSRTTKFKRMLSDLRNHTRSSLPCGKNALNLDYLKPLRNAIVGPLSKENVDKALEVMHANNLLRGDFDNILELTGWPQTYNDFNNVTTKIKAAFTRNYNKSTHMLPYAIETVVKKKKRTVVNDVDYGDESDSDDDVKGSDVDDIKNSAMIKLKPKIEKTSKICGQNSKAKKTSSNLKGNKKK